MNKLEFIKDKFSKSRGGHSRFLKIMCESCGYFLFHYQKDGPGLLKRLYLDRIIGNNVTSKTLICSKCKDTLGVYYIYPKENRPAYRLFAGEVKKQIVKKADLV